MQEAFEKQLVSSGYIHHLLKPDHSKSAEARLLNKKVLESVRLWDGTDLCSWAKDGTGELSIQDGFLRMTTPPRTEPSTAMPHYQGFHMLRAKLIIPGDNWQAYNRIRFRIRPSCNGFHQPFLMMGLRNDGVEKIPDRYYREGTHVLNLENFTWNECLWEFPELPRDRVTEVSFVLDAHGKELFGSDTFCFDIDGIRLERVEDPDISLGWEGARICFSTTGYWLNGKKIAVMPGESGGSFALVDAASGKTVYTGTTESLCNEKGRFSMLDFSGLNKPGRYYLSIGDKTGIENGSNNRITADFAVNNHVMEEAVWKAVNFIYAERCGYPVSGGHSFCHGDIMAVHKGLALPYAGGWHDAGDVSQQTLQTAEVSQALFELAMRVKDDIPLYRRLMEEARWGLDFVLRTRFGDGYRATSVGNTRWTNNLYGDGDDEPVRVHNRSFDNFLMAGTEAFAGYALQAEDRELAWVAVNAAKEDYGFARKRFAEIGAETCFVMEHTHNASLSLYYAAACWAAMQIFMAGGEDYFEKEARYFANQLLLCQDCGEAGLPFTGFFYRDETRKTIVHFNHQSREHLFIQALCGVCGLQKDITPYEDALRRYGGYLKAMYAYAAPYGMLPAGLHQYNEAEDAETFSLLHVMADFEAERDNYKAQLASGLRLTDRFCIRQFPVWFSFRGNAAVMLSSGKAASLIGGYFNDGALLDIARNQLYWMSGLNPFGQSLIYGEGSNYAQQYAALAGETVGEMPVGIQTRANEDRPYWPMANNATYKEIWLSTAGHWLRVVADLY